MESLEKATEEGFYFIQQFHLPVTQEEYFFYKNQIDLCIREFKEQNRDAVDQWKFEIKHILPGTGMISDVSNSLMQKLHMKLEKIIKGKPDTVLSAIFSEYRFWCREQWAPGSLESHLSVTLGTPDRRPVLGKLFNSSINNHLKYLIGVMMAPYVYLTDVLPFFLNGTLQSPTMDTCSQLIDYATSLGDHPDNYQKLYTMCHAVLNGATESDFSEIGDFIQESIDRDGNYDEVMAMKRINEYFRIHKNQKEANQKKIGKVSD